MKNHIGLYKQSRQTKSIQKPDLLDTIK